MYPWNWTNLPLKLGFTSMQLLKKIRFKMLLEVLVPFHESGVLLTQKIKYFLSLTSTCFRCCYSLKSLDLITNDLWSLKAFYLALICQGKETLPMVGTDEFNIKVINSTCTPTPYSIDTTYNLFSLILLCWNTWYKLYFLMSWWRSMQVSELGEKCDLGWLWMLHIC